MDGKEEAQPMCLYFAPFFNLERSPMREDEGLATNTATVRIANIARMATFSHG